MTSAPGKGSWFHVALPIINEEPTVDVPAADVELARGSELLLLVEDNDSVRRLARETLVRAGYRVIEARNGQEALAVGGPRLQEVALVITDMMMPVMGTQLAQQIRTGGPTKDHSRPATPKETDELWRRCSAETFTPSRSGRRSDVLDGLPLHSS